MTFGLACCAIEMISTYMAHHDLDRFGIVPWPSPRQSDVMIVAGTVTKKMAPAVKLLWEQMPYPKWSIAMGALRHQRRSLHPVRPRPARRGQDHPRGHLRTGLPRRVRSRSWDGFLALQDKIMETRARGA